MKIRKRGDSGRYMLDFADQDGIRQRITLPEGTTRRQAEDALDEIKRQVRKGVFAPPKASTPFKVVSRKWIELKKPKLRVTTWETYESHVRLHFGAFDDQAIQDVDTAMVEKWITDRQSEGMTLGSVRKILVSLNQIFNYAVRHKYMEHNPLSSAERPKASDYGETKDVFNVLTPDQVQELIKATYHYMYRTLFSLAVFSGARQGELLGLLWQDVDFEAGQISIKRTFTKGKFFPTKTPKSRRRIDIGPAVMSTLKKWKLACHPTNKEAKPFQDLEHLKPEEIKSIELENPELVFTTSKGAPINYNNMVRRHFEPALKAAGLPRIRFHDLRHSYASLQLGNGQTVLYVQNQLGHSSPTVTLNVYSHLLQDRNPTAAKALEDWVLKI